MSKPMKTLTLGDTIYEIVDEDVRKRVTSLEAKSIHMSTSINEDIKPLIETINNSITSINNNIDTINTNLNNTINDIDTNLNNKIDNKSEELETKINTKITNPETGEIGHILVVKELDENGKPIEYETIENVKSTYEYAKLGGYTGTEEELYKKLAQENTSKVEYDELKSDLGGYKFYHNPEIICVETYKVYETTMNSYVLSDSEEGIELLNDTENYIAASVIVRINDNEIYMENKEIDSYILADSEKGILMLAMSNEYKSNSIILQKTYKAYKVTKNEEYGLNRECYVLASSSLGNELLSITEKNYESVVINGDLFSCDGVYLTEIMGYASFMTYYKELERRIDDLQQILSNK